MLSYSNLLQFYSLLFDHGSILLISITLVSRMEMMKQLAETCQEHFSSPHVLIPLSVQNLWNPHFVPNKTSCAPLRVLIPSQVAIFDLWKPLDGTVTSFSTIDIVLMNASCTTGGRCDNSWGYKTTKIMYKNPDSYLAHCCWQGHLDLDCIIVSGYKASLESKEQVQTFVTI